MPDMNSITPPARTPSPIPYNTIFSAPPESIPEPLPTPEEIEDSADVIKQRRARCTARVGTRFVVKFGSGVDAIEGENLRFLGSNSAIPVPKVYAVYQREVTPRTTITYIVMEYLDGQPLDRLWNSLSITQKADIALQLRNAVISIRRTQHLGYFGSVDMTKPRDDIFWTDEPIRRDGGTYATEAHFTQGIIDKYVTYCGASEPQKADYYLRVLPTVLQGSGNPVFTHNDLQRKNIMVRPGGDIIIMGWAKAGWYPTYWEYSKAIHLCNWDDDWHQYLCEALQEFPNQHAWISILRNELWSHRIVR